MTGSIATYLKPEDEELLRKREELMSVRNLLAERELELTDLEANLAAFGGRFHRIVGVVYAELDEWYARYFELKAEIDDSDEAQEEAEEARARATDTYAEAHGEASLVEEFEPSIDLKSLFRETAKTIHPDFAVDEDDQKRRTQFMAQANEAYSKGDAEALQQIMDDYQESASPEKEESVGAELVRVIRQIARAKRRMDGLEQELSEMRSSDLGIMMEEEVNGANVNYLEDLAKFIRIEVERVKSQYEELAEEIEFD